MKKNYVTILVCLMFYGTSIFSQGSWNSISLSYTYGKVFKVYFYDANTGWILTQNNTPLQSRIMKTTNGGQNWVQQFSATNWLYSMYFIDNNTGWIGGRADGAQNVGLIYKTTNGGQNWNNPLTIDSLYFNDIKFINSNTGWAVGRGIVKTTNGGLNWTVQNFYKFYESVSFCDANTGWAVGDSAISPGSSELIVKTTNGGLTWTRITMGFYRFHKVYFVDNNTGWLSGYKNMNPNGGRWIMKTTNKGESWDYIHNQNNLSREYYGMYFVDANTGWASGEMNSIIKTTNGGINWYSQTLDTINIFLYDVYFLNHNTGWCTGEGGIIYKTIHGGNPIGIQTISTEIPKQFSLFQNYPNPFNPTTLITFDIVTKGNVKLTIFDVLGREIANLVDEQLKPGKYKANWNASNNTSGIYFYKLETIDFQQTRKMVLIK